MRLDKFLCDLQIGSRSQVRDAVKKGTVTVNGMIVKKPEFKINESADKVAYMGETLIYRRLYYYMLHKPAGVVTATKDSHDKTVMDLMRQAPEGENIRTDLFPAGRLDKDTEGLLLITNDGELAHRLLSPKKHVEKTYYVECSGTATASQLSQLEAGVDIGDEKPTLPAKVKLLSDGGSSDHCALAGHGGSSYTLELTVTEGRFHQVKRMIEAIGGSVTYLKRLSMGPLVLDENLPRGQYRALTEEEVGKLLKLKE